MSELQREREDTLQIPQLQESKGLSISNHAHNLSSSEYFWYMTCDSIMHKKWALNDSCGFRSLGVQTIRII